MPADKGESRAAATSKMESFVIIVKCSILDVAATLDPPLCRGIYINITQALVTVDY